MTSRLLTEEAYAEQPQAQPGSGCWRSPTKSGTPVICTQGKVIPDLIEWWCERDGVRPDKSRNRKGSVWVLSLSGGTLVAADHIGSPLRQQERPTLPDTEIRRGTQSPAAYLQCKATCGPSWPVPSWPEPWRRPS